MARRTVFFGGACALVAGAGVLVAVVSWRREPEERWAERGRRSPPPAPPVTEEPGRVEAPPAAGSGEPEREDGKLGRPANLAGLRGRVHAGDGSPVAGACILAMAGPEVGEASGSDAGGTLDPEEAFRLKWRALRRTAVRAETAADGTYHAEGLAPGPYRVTAVHEDFLPPEPRRLVLRAGEERQEDFTLTEGLEIRGRVVDDRGSPVPEAVVEAEPSVTAALRGWGRDRALAHRSGSFDLAGLLRESRTRESGAFHLTGLVRQPYHLRARAAGFREATVRDCLPAEREVEVVLERGAAIAGRVVVRERGPPPAVQVRLIPSGSLARKGAFSAAELDARALARAGDLPEEALSPEGAFEFAGLRSDEYVAAALAPGYAPALSEPVHVGEGERADAGELVLVADAPISGTVAGAGGRPVAGAAVRALFPSKGRPSWAGIRTRFVETAIASALTDGDGRYALTGLVLPEVDIEVHSRDHAPALRRRIPRGSARVDFTLSPALRLRGRVTDEATRRGIPEARVTCPPSQEAICDPDGFFALQGIAPPEDLVTRPFFIAVTARSSGYQVHRELVTWKPGASEHEYTVSLKRLLRIAGTVLSPAREPVGGAEVRAGVPGLEGWEPEETKTGPVVTREDGTFELFLESLALRGGGEAVRLEASHPEYAGARSGPLDGYGEGELGAVELILSAGQEISGRVTAGGAGLEAVKLELFELPVRGRRTALARALGLVNPWRRTFSGLHGEYALRRVPPGTYLLRAVAGGWAPHVEQVEVEEGEPVRRDLELSPGGAVRGTVRDTSGMPVPGAAVVAAQVDRPGVPDADREYLAGAVAGVARSLAKEDGTFELRGLPEGEELMLVARAAGFEPGFVTGVSPGASSVELRVARLASLSGTVRDSGSGELVEQFTVRLEGTEPLVRAPGYRGRMLFRPLWNRLGRGSRAVRSPGGRFQFLDVPPGVYRLTVASPGFGAWRADGIRLMPGGKEEVAVDLERGMRIAGTVVSRVDGKPIQGASVVLVPERRDGADFTVRGQTDLVGRYELEGLCAGRYELTVRHPEYAVLTREVPVGTGEEAGTAEPPLELSLIPAAVVEVDVSAVPRDLREGRYLGVTLRAAGGGEKPLRPGALLEGRYLFWSVPPGEHVVWVEPEGYEPFRSESVHAEAGERSLVSVDYSGGRRE